MILAPILLFTYKRLDALQETINALKNNNLAENSHLYIFSDGSRNTDDNELVNQVRDYIKTVSGFKHVTINESLHNKGLANSIISGVNKVLKFYDKVIVLEDDLITTPNFLSYMNQSLEYYQADQKVFSISGYSFDLGTDKEANTDAYFLMRGWSWGWATWKDRWEKVDWQVKDYREFNNNKKLKREFAKGGSDLNKMLRHQMQGKLDSWAIRWFYHQFKIGGLTLYPVYSKVDNNGFDAYATHTVGSNKRYQPLLDKIHSDNFSFPNILDIHPCYQKRFLQKMGIVSRIKSKLEDFVIKFKYK